MSKRGRSTDQLTGGTKDVSPQYMTLTLNMSAANTFTEQQIPVPVPRSKVDGQRVTIMEILKVYFDLSEADANPSAAGSVIQISAQIATRAIGSISVINPSVFASAQKTIRGAFTAAGSYATSYFDPFIYDCNDGAGHGILVATDNIFLGLNTVGFTAAGFCAVKVLYRQKNVTLAEYIGIVQSQQG